MNAMGFFARVLQLLIAIAACLCLATGYLLYEDEEGEIQSTFERWWISLDDQQAAALSKHKAFVNRAALLTNQALDQIFGSRWLSLQSVGVSYCLCVSSLFFFFLYYSGVGLSMWQLYGPVFLVVALLPSFTHRLRYIPLAAGLASVYPIATIIGMEFDFLNIGLWWYVGPRFFLPALFASTTLLATSRKVVRFYINSRYFLALSFVVLLVLILYVSLLLLVSTAGEFGIFLFGGNLGVLFVPLLFFGSALSLLAHRAFWPLPNRALYALQRSGVVKQKKTVRALGLFLLSLAMAPAVQWREQLLAIKNIATRLWE